MLKRLLAAIISTLIATGLAFTSSPAFSDECGVSVEGADRYGPTTITVSLSCSTGSGSSTNSNDTNSSGGSGCYTAGGTSIACYIGEYWWSSLFQMYCQVANPPANSLAWHGHLDAEGQPYGTVYDCLVLINDTIKQTSYWADTSAGAPASVVNPETIIRTAVTSLGLHPPTTGVGAYVYPGYEEWGLSWWVGAPMWLWVETTDPLQWGTHTISASESGVSVTATVAPSYVSYDPGDGSAPVTCGNPGTIRPWNRNDLMSNHSPSRCEHTYMTTNTLGDPDSRFSVTATVTWKVTWSATNGQNGSFTTDTTSTSTTSIHIGELRVVRVPNPPR